MDTGSATFYQNPAPQSSTTQGRMSVNDNSYAAVAAYIGLVIAKWASY